MAEKVLNEEETMAVLEGTPEEPAVPDSEPVTTEPEPEPAVQEITDTSVSEEEQKRRGFQAEADTAKQEAQLLQQQLSQQQRINAALVEQTNQMASIVRPFAPQENKPPEPDYVDEFGNFDQQKHQTWLGKVLERNSEAVVEKAKTAFKAEQNQATLDVQLDEVAKEFPEYTNPLTGKVDVERLTRDVQVFSGKKRLKDVVAEMKGKPVSSTLGKSMDAIEKNANKPSSVVKSQETENTPKQLGGDEKLIFDTFGEIDIRKDMIE